MNIAAAAVWGKAFAEIDGNIPKNMMFIHYTSKTIKTFFILKLNRLFVASITTVGNEEKYLGVNHKEKNPEIWKWK